MFEKLKEYCRKKSELIKQIPNIIYEVAEEARAIAIEAAINATPNEKDGKTRGRNTTSGSLKRGWHASDDHITRKGNHYYFRLKNDMEYASYVDKGHSMDQHFVLGLYIDPETNLICFEPNQEKAKEMGLGMKVGTKTSWVQGLYMTDKAREAFKNYIKNNLPQRIEEAKKNIFK